MKPITLVVVAFLRDSSAMKFVYHGPRSAVGIQATCRARDGPLHMSLHHDRGGPGLFPGRRGRVMLAVRLYRMVAAPGLVALACHTQTVGSVR